MQCNGSVSCECGMLCNTVLATFLPVVSPFFFCLSTFHSYPLKTMLEVEEVCLVWSFHCLFLTAQLYLPCLVCFRGIYLHFSCFIYFFIRMCFCNDFLMYFLCCFNLNSLCYRYKLFVVLCAFCGLLYTS